MLLEKFLKIVNHKGSLSSLIFIILISCNSISSKLDSFSNDLTYAEENYSDLNQEDWTDLERDYTNLLSEIEIENKLSDEERADFSKLQGRYSSLILKKGINDFNKTIENVSNQIDGFMEGFKSDSKNNNN